MDPSESAIAEETQLDEVNVPGLPLEESERRAKMESRPTADSRCDPTPSRTVWSLPKMVLVNLLRTAKIDKTYVDAARFHRYHTLLWKPPEAIGRVEHHGGALKAMVRKVVAQTQAVGQSQLQTVLDECCLTKNSMLRHGGYSPSQWILGKTPRGPPSLVEEDNSADLGSLEDQADPESRFALVHQARAEAKKAIAVLQGEPILPEGLVQGQQHFEDLRDVPGEDVEEDNPDDVPVEDAPQQDDGEPSYGLLHGPGPLRKHREVDPHLRQPSRAELLDDLPASDFQAAIPLKGAPLKELLDAGHVPISSECIDTIKNFHERLKPDYVPEFKSRLGSCGNFEDSTEARTDAPPTSDLETHPLVAAFAAAHGVPVESSDIRKAYFQAEPIDRAVLIRQPSGGLLEAMLLIRTIAVPGAVQITSVSEGTCMSINEIIPWKLVISQDGRCMDYHTDGSNNVYIAACHGNANQQWYMLDGNILSMMDNKCLDAHTSTDNVYMHECQHRQPLHARLPRQRQPAARQEMSSEAFITALHFDCIEDVGQQISVEPDGNNAMFRLRAGAHTLSEKFTYDSDTQKIKNIANNKCLEARGRGRVDEMDCTQRIEQDWTISHGLPGLVDAPITCPGDQVISHLKKTHGQVEYKCSHVSSLGMCSPHYSTQVETKTHELETIKALRELGAFCPPGEGLKTLETEASDKGAWIRFKYECCQISRVPVSIYPLMIADDKRDFDTDMAEAWEGVYCPSGSDDSGRLDFAQRRSFKPGQTASGSLTYDKNLGNWCVSGKGCAQSDVVHPLDTQLHTDDWYVVPVSDFDAIFEARGAKQVSTTKRKPPPLIQFGASDPEYLPECKELHGTALRCGNLCEKLLPSSVRNSMTRDESIPGSRKFTLAKMNAEAQNLDDENPCKYVYGVPPTNSDMDNADGLTGWIDDLVENVGPGQGGVTYKSVKECADRDDIRALQMAKWSQSHNYHSIGFGFVKDLWDAYADGMPEVEAAPLGAGFEFQPGSVMAAYGALYFGMLQMSEDIRLQQPHGCKRSVLICQSAAAALHWANGQSCFAVRPLWCGAAPEHGSACGYLVQRCGERRPGRDPGSRGDEELLLRRAEAGSLLGLGSGGMSQANGQQGPQDQQPAGSDGQAVQPPGGQQVQAEQFVDRIVRQRLDQAFTSIFGKLLESSERTAKAAEQQAGSQRTDNLVKSLKVEAWKPQSREKELKTWREWWFSLTNYLSAHDAEFEEDLKNIDLETPVDHAILPDSMVQRSTKLYGLLCSLLKGRPLLIVRGVEASKSGYEAVRLLKREMEPKEKARSLALLRQLASWKFDGPGGVYEQLIKYEDALQAYETAAAKEFPKELVLATVLTGIKEPLRSQVQMRMTATTTYAELREWILQYEALNSPWGAALGARSGSGGGKHDDGGQQPMDVDRVWAGKGKSKDGKGKTKDGKGKSKDNKGKSEDGKGKSKDGKGKGGKSKDGKGYNSVQQRYQWGAGGWGDADACRICGQRGHWKWECPQAASKGKGAWKGTAGKGKVQQVEQVPSSSASAAPSSASTVLPGSVSTYRGSSATVNLIEAFVHTPPGCRVTEDGGAAFVVEGAGGFEAYRLDATDGDNDWTLAPGVLTEGLAVAPQEEESMESECESFAEALGASKTVAQVNAICAGTEVDVIIDSGADISVAPLRLGRLGRESKASGVLMQDAQGWQIRECGSRVIDIEVETVEGTRVVVREKFAVARVESVILSLGRLLRWGCLGHCLLGTVARRVTELDLERSLWDMEDWTWILTLPTEDYEGATKIIAELDEDLDGPRDVVALFHVAKLPKDILSNPSGVFSSEGNDGESPFVPAGGDHSEDDGRGVGLELDEIDAEP
eukprot:s2610_g16.t1